MVRGRFLQGARRSPPRCGSRPARNSSETGAAIDLFRITQEALTNVARHASASRAEVSLREAGGAIVLEIGDDGVGIPRDRANDERSFGLMGIRERARELGGEVAIRGDEGRGTLVYVSIPLPPSGSLP